MEKDGARNVSKDQTMMAFESVFWDYWKDCKGIWVLSDMIGFEGHFNYKGENEI